MINNLNVIQGVCVFAYYQALHPGILSFWHTEPWAPIQYKNVVLPI